MSNPPENPADDVGPDPDPGLGAQPGPGSEGTDEAGAADLPAPEPAASEAGSPWSPPPANDPGEPTQVIDVQGGGADPGYAAASPSAYAAPPPGSPYPQQGYPPSGYPPAYGAQPGPAGPTPPDGFAASSPPDALALTEDVDAGPPHRSRATVVAAVLAVAALLIGLGIGWLVAPRGSDADTGSAAAPATVTAQGPTSTELATQTQTQTATEMVTSTAAPVTQTVSAPAVTETAQVTETVEVTVTEQSSAPAAGLQDGVSLVGVDVQPGTYRTDSDSCYWARLSGTSGELDDIIANGNGATVVTIDPTDVAFESRDCAPWTEVG